MDNWVEIIDTNDEIEAQIVKNILEAENIPVVINSMKIRPYPVSIGRIGEVKLLVMAKDIEKARDVIRIMKDIPSEEEQDGN
ncbi:MAG: DUF2007 domain-containing protein [Nitrospirota bacterium]